MTTPPQVVPDCKSVAYWVKVKHEWRHWDHGPWKWSWRWEWVKRYKKIADPSPCVSRRYLDRNGDSHVEILILEGDPKFGRR